MINDSAIGMVRFRLRKENLKLSEKEKELDKKIEKAEELLEKFYKVFDFLKTGSWTVTGISLAPFLFSFIKETGLLLLLFSGTFANAGFGEMEALDRLEQMIEANHVTIGTNVEVVLRLLATSVAITGVGKVGEEVLTRISNTKRKQEILDEKKENEELKVMLQDLTSDDSSFHLIFIRDFLGKADLSELSSEKTFSLFKELLKYYKVAKLYEDNEATKEELRSAAVELSYSLAKIDKRFMNSEYQEIFLDSYNSQKGK